MQLKQKTEQLSQEVLQTKITNPDYQTHKEPS